MRNLIKSAVLILGIIVSCAKPEPVYSQVFDVIGKGVLMGETWSGLIPTDGTVSLSDKKLRIEVPSEEFDEVFELNLEDVTYLPNGDTAYFFTTNYDTLVAIIASEEVSIIRLLIGDYGIQVAINNTSREKQQSKNERL